MDNIQPQDISFNAVTDTYTLVLPPAQLTSCYLDAVATEQYDFGGATPVCPANSDEMRRLASYEALNQFRDDAVENGILDQAESASETVLSNFIRALTGKNVVIVFQDAATSAIPQSCAPEPPGTWRYNVEQDRWMQ